MDDQDTEKVGTAPELLALLIEEQVLRASYGEALAKLSVEHDEAIDFVSCLARPHLVAPDEAKPKPAVSDTRARATALLKKWGRW